MSRYNYRFVEIVQLLSQTKSYRTLQELSNYLHVSSKTISRTIKAYEADTEAAGFLLKATQGHGYKLTIIHQKKFEAFKKHYFTHSDKTRDEKSLREKQIIQLLLAQNEFVTIQYLADQLFISESTLSTDLKGIKQHLQSIGLKLKHKTAKGIKIEGSEMSIRLAYAKYVMDISDSANPFDYSLETVAFLEEAILNVLLKWQVQMSDLSQSHFVSHVLISIYRMQQGFFITFDEAEKRAILQTKEFRIAEDIVRLIKEQLQIVDDEEEIIYLAIQLLGKRSLSTGKDEVVLSAEIEELLMAIFHEIKKRLAVDLTEDDTVFNYLALHFEPMFTRLKYKIKSNNPLLEEVKSQQATSFEMGLIAKEMIIQQYQYHLDDDEVSYLAMYFSLALDRLKYLKKPKNILIVCGLGVCSSRILVYKLRQQYGNYINDIVTCQFHELKHISLRSFDCIISTIKQPIGTTVPVIYIDNFMNDLNNQALDHFFLEQHSSDFQLSEYLKEEYFFEAEAMENEAAAISYLLGEVNKIQRLPFEAKQYVLDREALSSTAFGHFCALPHPIKMCTEETIFAVLVLGRSMQWGGKKVRVVFLLLPSQNHPEDLRRFNEALASFILDSKRFTKFSRSPNFETLKAVFLNK